jgi:hypothetical protein
MQTLLTLTLSTLLLAGTAVAQDAGRPERRAPRAEHPRRDLGPDLERRHGQRRTEPHERFDELRQGAHDEDGAPRRRGRRAEGDRGPRGPEGRPGHGRHSRRMPGVRQRPFGARGGFGPGGFGGGPGGGMRRGPRDGFGAGFRPEQRRGAGMQRRFGGGAQGGLQPGRRGGGGDR